MAGGNRRLARGQLAFDDVQVGAADSAYADANQNLAGAGLRLRLVDTVQGIGFHSGRSMEYAGQHSVLYANEDCGRCDFDRGAVGTTKMSQQYIGLMQLVVENFESMAPVILNPSRVPRTDEESVAFCQQYEDCFVECTAEGEIIIMPPNYSRTGKQNLEIIAQLVMWGKKDGRGDVYDSSAGFLLPNGARRSPDASWIRKDRVAALPRKQQEGFYHLCPDFAIELRSSADRINRLKAKMEEYIANGAELGWLIDPKERAVWIYRPGSAAECVANARRIPGEGPVAGFVLELAGIWA
jgi:Uma2 family endonuclease